MTPHFQDAPGHTGWNALGLLAQHVKLLNSGSNSPLLEKPIEKEAEVLACAVGALQKLGSGFWGDVRLGRNILREMGTNGGDISNDSMSVSEGIGVRVWNQGAWGHASTSDLSPASVQRCVQRAMLLSKAALVTVTGEKRRKAALAAEPPHRASFHTPIALCPFLTPSTEILGELCRSGERALSQTGIKRAMGYLETYGFRRWYANTDGAQILRTHAIVDGGFTVTAVEAGTSAYRTQVVPALAGGVEHVLAAGFYEKTDELCSDALRKCHAKTPSSGTYDLILDPHHLALTIHESVGHPTELDRVLGYELSYAGGSFASLDKKGHYQYASPIVNLTANNTLRFGAATQGFDDEGVAMQEFPIVSNGVLVGYGTNRETASEVGLARSNGCARSVSWGDVPIVRIPNLMLEPGRQKLSLQDLISDTKNGIYMCGRDSFSIDQMRYNFQFGANMCWKIENGHITEPLRDVIYQSMTPEFWNSCDAICDANEWRMHGIFNCGKGQPGQSSKMMHGASPARFRNIQVGY